MRDLFKDKKGSEFIAEVFEVYASTSTRDALEEIVRVENEAGKLRELLENRTVHNLFKRIVMSEARAEGTADLGDEAFGVALCMEIQAMIEDVLFVNRPSIIIAELLKHPAAAGAMRHVLMPYKKKLKKCAAEGKLSAASTISELLSA